MIDSEFDRVIRGESVNNYKNNKKGNWKIIISIIIFIIIAVGAVFGYLYYSKYKASIPKIKFFEYLDKTNISQITDTSILKEIYNKMGQTSYTVNSNISIANGDQENILSKINANIDYYSDNEKKLYKTDLKINNVEEEIIKITGIADDKNIGIKSDEIVIKYVGSKISNLNKVLGNLENQDNGENSREKISIPNEEILNNYKEIINSKLLDEQFSIEKNVKLTEGNSSVNTTLYKLSFDKDEIIQIITELQELLINDDELIKCLITGQVGEQYDYNGISLTDAFDLILGYKVNVSILKIKEEIENNFTEIFEILNSIENLKFEFDIYVSDSKVIKEVISLENLIELTLDFETKSKDENYAKVTILLKDKETGNKNGCSFSLNRKNDNFKTNFIAEISLIENMQINNKVILDTSLEGNSSSKDIKNNIKITYSDTESEYIVKINSKLEYILNEEIERLNEENCLFLDELDEQVMQEVKLNIYEKTKEVFSYKINNIINPEEEPNNKSNQIVNMDEQDEEEKLAVRIKLIDAITKEMEKAQEEEREYTLMDLQELVVEDSTVSVMVNENMAIIAIDGYTFYIDPTFNLTEE